jgi:methionine-S-sulfoxide reductase
MAEGTVASIFRHMSYSVTREDPDDVVPKSGSPARRRPGVAGPCGADHDAGRAHDQRPAARRALPGRRGYCGGATPNPTYEEVCSGLTAHTEAVRVVFLPTEVSYGDLLRVFWEAHDPTQGMRQGNDVGTQYRSGIYWHEAGQREVAEDSMIRYQAALAARGYGAITTEVEAAGDFYYAEEYHQQYLARNPGGYCGLGGTGVGCPAGIGEASDRQPL